MLTPALFSPRGMARGRCEASGSGRGVGDGAAGLEQCDYVSPSATSQREFFTKTSPLLPHGIRRKVEQIKNHGEAVDVIRSLSAAWNHHEVMHVINPKVNTRCCVMPYRRKATNSIHRTSRGNYIPILRIG